MRDIEKDLELCEAASKRTVESKNKQTEEKTVLLEKLNACRAEIVGVQATLWNIRAACEKHRDPLYGFSPLELEILAILGIDLGSKKSMFEWCPKCKFFNNCYGDPDAINPKYLEPRCGEGPVLEEIGG